MNDQTLEQIGRVLGRIPSGCVILTARAGGQSLGMLASWMQQAAFDPPAISISVKKGRPIEALIDESGSFVANLIGEDPARLFKQFGKGFSLGEDSFAGLKTRDVPSGVIIEEAVAWLSGKVRGKHDAGDHWLYVAELTDAGMEGQPTPYVHLRRNGLNY